MSQALLIPGRGRFRPDRIAGLAMWQDATAIALADGTRMSQWDDRSGSTRHAKQATAGQQPLFERSANSAGLPGVRFAASRNDALLTDAFTAVAEPATVIVVTTVPSATPAASTYLFEGVSPGRRGIFFGASRYISGIAQATGNATGRRPGGVRAVAAVVYNGASSKVRVNGVETAANLGTGQSPTKYTLGARYDSTAGYDGWLHEVLVFHRALSSAEIAVIERYAALKWNLQLAGDGVYWIDTANGNSSHDGRTPSTPLTLLSTALTAHGSSAQPFYGYIAAPQATPLREQVTVSRDNATFLLPLDGSTPWFIYGSEQFTTGWTDAGGGVYSRAVTGYTTDCNGVLVSTLTDADGNWRRLTKNTGTPTAPAAGEFGTSITAGTGTLYVHLPADASANSHTIEAAKRDYGIWSRKAGLTTDKHGRYYAANVAGHRLGSTTVGENGNTASEDSEAWYCNVGGFATAAGTWTSAAYTRCDSYANLNDGFNVHGGESGGAPTGTQVATMTDCDAAYNGDEGCSAHERTTVIQTGGRMHHNASGGITHINNVSATITGVEIDHNQRVNPSTDSGGANFLDSVSGTMTGCNVHDNPHEGIKRFSTATIAVNGNTSGTAAGNGLPDNLAA